MSPLHEPRTRRSFAARSRALRLVALVVACTLSFAIAASASRADACIPGDCNANGDLDAGDPVCTVLCLIGSPEPGADCACAADCNCVGGTEAADPICTVLRLIDDFEETCEPSNPSGVKWQKYVLDFAGPLAGETDDVPNPFLQYRMDVTFTRPSASEIVVPGFFAGDGEGGGTGNVWRVILNPDEAGTWSYDVSFHEGVDAAILPGTGTPLLPDGETGTFEVADLDPGAPGFAKWGLLEYQSSGPTLARYYLEFRDGPHFLKGGANGPEDFLGYSGFDNTPAPATDGTAKGILFDYAAHVVDWNAGDPTWTTTNPDSVGDEGKGIIGALNYLAEQHVNSIFFEVNTIGGDTQETYPWVGPIAHRGGDQDSGYTANDNTHYDVSKLEQWEIVFAHAQRKGLLLHVVLNEGEGTNKRELDDGVLGTERKLFYRELVARFAHHNAMQWNVCIEYDGTFNPPSGATGETLQFSPATIREFADYIAAVDPYDHPITVHNTGRLPEVSFDPFLGDTQFGTTSFQDFEEVGGLGAVNATANVPGLLIETMRERTADEGWPLPMSLDEARSTVDDGLLEPGTGASMDDQRREITWPTYLSGGNYENHLHLAEDPPPPGWDHDVQDFRIYEQSLEWMWYARRFTEALPFWEMEPNDDRVVNDSDAEVFEKPGEYYGIYLPNSGDPEIDLTGAPGTFVVRWIDPLTGLVIGADTTIAGGAVRTITRPVAIDDEAALYVWRDDLDAPTP